MNVRTWSRSALGLCLATAALSACNTSDKGSLSLNDKLTLVQAVTSSNAFADMGAAAPFAPIAVTLLGSTGTLAAGTAPSGAGRGTAFDILGTQATSYDGAFGVQVVFSVATNSGSDTGSFTGVVGWTGLNTTANTVDELVSAGVLTEDNLTPVGNGVSTPIGDTASAPLREGFARYTSTPAASSYVGTSGTFVLGNASFAASGTDCSQTYNGHTVSCAYTLGTMSGNFSFSADRISGAGATPYIQPNVTFTNLPSIKITINVAQ